MSPSVVIANTETIGDCTEEGLKRKEISVESI